MTAPNDKDREQARAIVARHNELWNDVIAYPQHLTDAIANALTTQRQQVRAEERERVISMADALEYELPNLEQMKGVAVLRHKLQTEAAAKEATTKEGD